VRPILLPLLTVLIAIVATAVAAGEQQQATSPASTFLGVVRGDGLLIPVASLVGDQWRQVRTVDSTGGAFRLLDPAGWPRDRWMFHAIGAAPVRPLRLLGQVTTKAYCMEQDAFTTDAPPAGGAVEVARLMRGVAVTGTMAAAPVEDASSLQDDSRRRAAASIVQVTQSLEADRLAAAGPSSPLVRTTAQQRQQATVVITTLSRVRQTFSDTYYFEARKRYGGFETYATGWLVSSRSSIALLNASGGVDSGGETVRRRGRVLGALQTGPGVTWVMEMRGYEGDSYQLLRIGSIGLEQILSVHGGGC
jgi:hypothetical protein